MFKTISLIVVAVLAVGIGAVLAIAATKPDTSRVQRSAAIKAPPEKIFPLINDFHRWDAWSPWEKMDPAMKRTHSGAASGKGAVYEWEGNDKVGKGRMEIAESSPPSKVAIKLDFARIRCEQTDDQTQDGRFTATAGTDQRSNLAARNFEVDVGNRDIVAENFADRAKVNERVHALMQTDFSALTGIT